MNLYKFLLTLRFNLHLLHQLMNSIYNILTRKAVKSTLQINIKELNKIGKEVLYYQKDLNNPTYADKAYVIRKQKIVERSKLFKIEDPSRDIQYHKEEHQVWGKIYSEMSFYHSHVMSSLYNKQRKQLESQFNIKKEIPKMSQISQYLQNKTGFQVIPAPGIVSQRDFLNALAFKVFMASEFMRHPETLHHAPEPDVFHEYIGHIPNLANKDIANLSHQLGLLSLGASDQELKMLGNTYLFTIEFGLCRQENKIKAYGAAISSCLKDIKRIYQNRFTYKTYEPEKDWMRPFVYDGEQSDFLLVQSFEDALQKIKAFSNTIKSEYECSFDEITKNVTLKRKKQLIEAEKAFSILF